MPSVETLVWVLTGALTLISILGGVIWVMLREESKEHALQLKANADSITAKASLDNLNEAEARLIVELKAVKESSEQLVNKLEARHDKELDQMATRLGEQIKSSENNILTQIRLMIEVIKVRDRQ